MTSILKATEPEEKKEKLEEWKKRVGYKQAEVISREATNRGSSMHDYLEKFLLGKLNLDLLGQKFSTYGSLINLPFKTICPLSSIKRRSYLK